MNAHAGVSISKRCVRAYPTRYFPLPVVLIPATRAILNVHMAAEAGAWRILVEENLNQNSHAPPPSPGERPTVLIIDDNGAIRAHLQAMVERMGYAVVTAADGFQGLATFRAIHPALVLTDIVMSEKDGIEVIRELRGEYPDVKIIAMSGSGPLGNSDLIDLAVKLGADASMQKPIDRETLKEILGTLLHPGS